MTAITIGIHDLAFATSHYVLDLRELAAHGNIDVNKFYVGLGQSEMSVLAEDEDIVTMAAEAAGRITDRHGVEGIRTLLFATESGVDQSKAAGTYVHSLLGLSANCRVTELKQACYSATAALQFALGVIARNPEERVLVIASDVARYQRDSSGEATQGAGAVAMLVTANPALVAIEPASGLYSKDVHDFWRPNSRLEALVDGKFSMQNYLECLEGAWKDFSACGGASFDAIDQMCYHQPFTKMAVKAQERLQSVVRGSVDPVECMKRVGTTLELNRRVGNTYTASLYLGLLSLLNYEATDLVGKRVGFFSYGSGSVSEFFTGIVQPGYRQSLRIAKDEVGLSARVPLSYEQYRELHDRMHLVEGTQFVTAQRTTAPFRFAGVHDHMRRYEAFSQRHPSGIEPVSMNS